MPTMSMWQMASKPSLSQFAAEHPAESHTDQSFLYKKYHLFGWHTLNNNINWNCCIVDPQIQTSKVKFHDKLI